VDISSIGASLRDRFRSQHRGGGRELSLNGVTLGDWVREERRRLSALEGTGCFSQDGDVLLVSSASRRTSRSASGRLCGDAVRRYDQSVMGAQLATETQDAEAAWLDADLG
jgi:hypothetical protein